MRQSNHKARICLPGLFFLVFIVVLLFGLTAGSAIGETNQENVVGKLPETAQKTALSISESVPADGFSSLDALNDAFSQRTVWIDYNTTYVAHGYLKDQAEWQKAATADPWQEPLSVVYVQPNEPFMYVNETATFTVVSEGGCAPLRYSYSLFWQSFSATDNRYSWVNSVNNVTSNTYTYTPSASHEGRLMLQTTIVDATGEYLVFGTYASCVNRADLADKTTLAGKVKWIIDQNITSDMSDYQKALALHDWLIYNANYDWTFTNYDAEGVLLEGTGVCHSYALAYQIMLWAVDIPAIHVTGSGNGGAHAWNLVRMDHDWYHVDCTWDDPNSGGRERHTYFGLTDAMIGKDHAWGENVLPDGYNISYIPACTATYYNYSYISGNIPLVQSISLSKASVAMDVGDQETLAAVISPSPSRVHALVWSSSNPDVAIVNAKGEVWAVKAGNSIITCRESNGSHPVTCAATVLFASSPGNGDTNADGSVDIMDLVAVIEYIVAGTEPVLLRNADVNGDGTVNIQDLAGIVDIIIGAKSLNTEEKGATESFASTQTTSIAIPFASAISVNALEIGYELSNGLALVDAECSDMMGIGGDSKAVFFNLGGGVQSGTITLQVRLKDGVTEDQIVNITAINGANGDGIATVGKVQSYIVKADGSKPLSIITQPENTTAAEGTKARFTVDAAGGNAPLAYQWYINANAGLGWLAIAGATADTCITDMLSAAENKIRYFCRVTDSSGAHIDSTIVTLTVISVPRTGDASHFILWVVFAGLSFAIASGILRLILQNRTDIVYRSN